MLETGSSQFSPLLWHVGVLLRPKAGSCLFQKCSSALMRIVRKILLLHHCISGWCTFDLSLCLNDKACWEQNGKGRKRLIRYERISATPLHCFLQLVWHNCVYPADQTKSLCVYTDFSLGRQSCCLFHLILGLRQGVVDIFQLMPCNYVCDGVQGPQDVTGLFLGIWNKRKQTNSAHWKGKKKKAELARQCGRNWLCQ